MSAPNALLVRWQYGYTEVTAPGATELRWGYLTLGSLDLTTAERVALQELDRLSKQVEQISLDADPNPIDPDNAYGTGWDLGDYVLVRTRSGLPEALVDENGDTLVDENGDRLVIPGVEPNRVMQITAEEDVNGILTPKPDLVSLLDQIEVRQQRSISHMIDGTLNGTSAVAQPITAPEYVPARRPGSTTETFSWNPLTTRRSGPWTPEVNGRIAQFHLKRGGGDNSGEIRVAILLNGITVDEGIIWSGDEEGIFGGTGLQFGPEDKIELEPTEISGATNLTVRAIQTHYH